MQPIYNGHKEIIDITLNQIRLGSGYASHKHRIYLKEIGV